jgi:ectoine hydroxylase-related dioxygenase (phytanoyl-CoA dioxygenase family)
MSQTITDEQMSVYFKEGYVILEDVVAPESLAEAKASYEQTIAEALLLRRAPRDESTGFLKGHRFQNPHHPALAQRPLMEALSTPDILDFAQRLSGDNFAMYGIAAFAMNDDFDYKGAWHRDTYSAWGKDSPRELRVREIERMHTTQILLALHDDDCFWMVPRSHNRANTEEEETRFEDNRTGWEEMFSGAVQVKLRAGSAVPFDARCIHRGLKRPGKPRRSLFIVYGTTDEACHSGITGWAKEPEYSEESYLDSLPIPLRNAIENTQSALKT